MIINGIVSDKVRFSRYEYAILKRHPLFFKLFNIVMKISIQSGIKNKYCKLINDNVTEFSIDLMDDNNSVFTTFIKHHNESNIIEIHGITDISLITAVFKEESTIFELNEFEKDVKKIVDEIWFNRNFK